MELWPVVLLGGAGAALGLVVGALLRRPARILAACAALVLAYLAFVWTTAPTSFSGCHDCWEWHGRYAEWNLVALVVAANSATLLAAALLAGLVSRRLRR